MTAPGNIGILLREGDRLPIRLYNRPNPGLLRRLAKEANATFRVKGRKRTEGEVYRWLASLEEILEWRGHPPIVFRSGRREEATALDIVAPVGITGAGHRGAGGDQRQLLSNVEIVLNIGKGSQVFSLVQLFEIRALVIFGLKLLHSWAILSAGPVLTSQEECNILNFFCRFTVPLEISISWNEKNQKEINSNCILPQV